MKSSIKSTSKSQVNFFHLTFSYWMKVLIAEFVGSKTIECNQSIKGTRGDVTLWKIHEHSRYILSALLHNFILDGRQ